MDATLDIIVFLFCIIDIGLGTYGLVNALLLTSSKKLNPTYKHYFSEYNLSLLKINIMLIIMCLVVAFINLLILVVKNKSILKKYLRLYKVKKFNNSIFMFRIEKSAVEKMIIRHEEEKVRKEKNANSIWIIFFWIILIYLRVNIILFNIIRYFL